MVFAAELAREAGLIDHALVERHRRVLGALGLPTSDVWSTGGPQARFGRLLEAAGGTLRERERPPAVALAS